MKMKPWLFASLMTVAASSATANAVPELTVHAQLDQVKPYLVLFHKNVPLNGFTAQTLPGKALPMFFGHDQTYMGKVEVKNGVTTFTPGHLKTGLSLMIAPHKIDSAGHSLTVVDLTYTKAVDTKSDGAGVFTKHKLWKLDLTQGTPKVLTFHAGGAEYHFTVTVAPATKTPKAIQTTI